LLIRRKRQTILLFAAKRRYRITYLLLFQTGRAA
jgi:hypothetical protein